MTDVWYTTIVHPARRALGLEIVDYCIADYVYHSSAAPGAGMCTATRSHLAKWIGVSVRRVAGGLKTLLDAGLVEKVSSGDRHVGWRPTAKWYAHAIDSSKMVGANSAHPPKQGAESAPRVQNVHPVGAKSAPGGANSARGEGADSAPHYSYSLSGKDKRELLFDSPGSGAGAERDFERFWQVYPKKQNKKDARKAFDGLKNDRPNIDTLVAQLERAKKMRQWREDGGKYIPLAGSWLRGRRWEDELDVEVEPLPAQDLGQKVRPKKLPTYSS